jgi:predicted GNAT family acetyltransferase
MFRIRQLSIPEFAEEVVPLLAERELENNLVIGLAERLAGDPEAAKHAISCAIEHGGRCVAGALWTPPHFAVVSPLPPGAEEALVPALVALNRGLDGACGPGDSAGRVARALAERVRGHVELASDEILYELTRVESPRAPAGAARWAALEDLPIVTDFMRRFFDEVRLPHPPEADAIAARAVAEHRALLWDDAGACSLACQARSMLTGAAIAPVYTPPRARGRGYASALTAALCRSLLDAGHRFVCLHADRANPTANRVYQALGFRPKGPFQVWAVR